MKRQGTTTQFLVLFIGLPLFTFLVLALAQWGIGDPAVGCKSNRLWALVVQRRIRQISFQLYSSSPNAT